MGMGMMVLYYHGNRDNTAVMGIDFMTDNAIIAGMGTALMAAPR